MELNEFLKLEYAKIAHIISESGKPRNVALMIDGTRRMLKLEATHHSDPWLYDEEHIANMMHHALASAVFFYELGIPYVMGPLVSQGNLAREKFMPQGLQHLLDPLFDSSARELYDEHHVDISFYGDLDSVKSFPGGDILASYQQRAAELRPVQPKNHLLIGLGFSSDRETVLLARHAIEHYKKTAQEPTHDDLCTAHFGKLVPQVDIFIRTNEVRASGGLTPLLNGRETQLYFPVSPGIVSFTKPLLRTILYDYLFSRSIAGGAHQHQPITPAQAREIEEFYHDHKNMVLGLGRRIGDIWIAEP